MMFGKRCPVKASLTGRKGLPYLGPGEKQSMKVLSLVHSNYFFISFSSSMDYDRGKWDNG
jgi:hypothetical protein